MEGGAREGHGQLRKIPLKNHFKYFKRVLCLCCIYKGHKTEDSAMEKLREEMQIVEAENETLKRLLQAKDGLIIQKTSLIDNIKVK